MFDIGITELLLIVIVAVVVIGPKDLPLAMRTAGRWIGKMRKISGHFRAGIDAMVREAEMEDMEKKWREQNDAIMKAHPALPDGEEMRPIAVSAEGAAMPVETPGSDKPGSEDMAGSEGEHAAPPVRAAEPGPLGYGAQPDPPKPDPLPSDRPQSDPPSPVASEAEPQLPLSR